MCASAHDRQQDVVEEGACAASRIRPCSGLLFLSSSRFLQLPCPILEGLRCFFTLAGLLPSLHRPESNEMIESSSVFRSLQNSAGARDKHNIDLRTWRDCPEGCHGPEDRSVRQAGLRSIFCGRTTRHCERLLHLRFLDLSRMTTFSIILFDASHVP